jgi:hypothetical protein
VSFFLYLFFSSLLFFTGLLFQLIIFPGWTKGHADTIKASFLIKQGELTKNIRRYSIAPG